MSQGGAFLSCPGSVDLGVLLPHLAGVIVEEVTAAAGLLLLLARARAATAACPACGTVSGQVHSRYSRTLADAAIGGRQVEILLTARRFFCTSPACKARTFAEQVDGLTSRYARKTPLLAGVLGSIAVALAGRAGSRLASGLAVPASRQVMLRLVMAIPDPAAASPRAAGVDDFAIRPVEQAGLSGDDGTEDGDAEGSAELAERVEHAAGGPSLGEQHCRQSTTLCPGSA